MAMMDFLCQQSFFFSTWGIPDSHCLPEECHIVLMKLCQQIWLYLHRTYSLTLLSYYKYNRLQVLHVPSKNPIQQAPEIPGMMRCLSTLAFHQWHLPTMDIPSPFPLPPNYISPGSPWKIKVVCLSEDDSEVSLLPFILTEISNAQSVVPAPFALVDYYQPMISGDKNLT